MNAMDLVQQVTATSALQGEIKGLLKAALIVREAGMSALADKIHHEADILLNLMRGEN